MKLFEDIGATVKSMLDDAVKSRNKQLELDLKRLGSDIVTLAEQVGQIMSGLSLHKEAIEQLASNHQLLVQALANKPTMKWPSLGNTKKKLGLN